MYAFSLSLMNDVFQEQVSTDLIFAIGSLSFVFIYMCIHLRSFFLGGFAMSVIIFSFPVTVVIYKVVFGITYLSTLHQLVIFIVLGIAADDVFVFVDAWRQSAHYPEELPNTYARMHYAWKRAAKAMLVTSGTTSFAFLANAFSSLMPIQTFGIYAALIIPVNYVLVITYYSALLIVWERNLKHCCTCCFKKKEEPSG